VVTGFAFQRQEQILSPIITKCRTRLAVMIKEDWNLLSGIHTLLITGNPLIQIVEPFMLLLFNELTCDGSDHFFICYNRRHTATYEIIDVCIKLIVASSLFWE
jgi:hypothetical protein